MNTNNVSKCNNAKRKLGIYLEIYKINNTCYTELNATFTNLL